MTWSVMNGSLVNGVYF